jgi:hypothetical protein
LSRAGPLDGPSLRLAILIGSFHCYECMRIAKHELNQLALDLDLFVEIVCRLLGMMRISADRNNKHCCKNQRYFRFHVLSPSAGLKLGGYF